MISLKNNLNTILKPLKSFFPLGKNSVKTNYCLIQKPKILPINTMTNSSSHVPTEATAYSIVTVGRKDNPDFQRNVLTFYRNKEIIKRIFTGTNQTPRIRIYNTTYDFVKNNWENILKTRTIQTKEYNKKAQEWKVTSEEEQFIHHYLNEIKGRYHRKKLHINKNVFENKDNKQIINASITEYPSTKAEQKKELIATISIDKDIPKITSLANNSDFVIPQNDDYLPYRFLLGRQKQTSLTRNELNKNGLEPLDIGIHYSQDIVNPNAEGVFDSIEGNVFFRDVSSDHPIIISAHEGEHARQFSLLGRLGKLKTKYGFDCQKKLPPISDSRTLSEGFDYLIAYEKYPKTSPTEDLRKNKLYWDNGLEEGARNKAEYVTLLYGKCKKAFTDYFKFSVGKKDF